MAGIILGALGLILTALLVIAVVLVIENFGVTFGF
jgi:hypothetical protein